jgi:hypothetical protein
VKLLAHVWSCDLDEQDRAALAAMQGKTIASADRDHSGNLVLKLSDGATATLWPVGYETDGLQVEVELP